MKKFLLILLILVVAGYGAWKTDIIGPRGDSLNDTQELSPLSDFSWRFEAAPPTTPDIPETRIILNAMYENGRELSKSIATFPGSCNEVDPKRSEDQDMVSGSTKIQCYAAGLGYWFKITQADSFTVVRKMFEESAPNYDPPVYEYEAVVEFPLLY